MKMLDQHHAMECESHPADWASLGSRILRVATIATAMHLAEQARRQALEAEAGAVIALGGRRARADSAATADQPPDKKGRRRSAGLGEVLNKARSSRT